MEQLGFSVWRKAGKSRDEPPFCSLPIAEVDRKLNVTVLASSKRCLPRDSPPEQRFIKAETWNKQVRKEGIVVAVPVEAQQIESAPV
jgi:hypothetical protein